MGIELDHLILAAGDVERSIGFYQTVLGLRYEGDDGPFSIVRVSPGFVILLAHHVTSGGEHLAFAMPKAEFDTVFARLRAANVPYGDSFERVGSMTGPCDESGARGIGKALYFFDPDRHLIEIRHYEAT